MKMTVSDYRVLRKACALLRAANEGTINLRVPLQLEGAVDPESYMLSLGDSHRLYGIQSEIYSRIEMLEELQTL